MGYQKTESQHRNDIIEICKRVYDKGWVAANDGNISIRIGPNSVLCTPTGKSKGFLTSDQLVKVDMDGNKLEGELEPSSEVKIHLDVFKNKEGIKAAVHAHPPYATGFAVAGMPLDKCVIPEIIISLGSIPLAAYGTPSTFEIPDNIRKYLKNHNAFLLENHGAFTIGDDLYQAYYRMESLELFAQISLFASMAGQVNAISEENVEKLISMRGNYVKEDDYAGCRVDGKLITGAKILENNGKKVNTYLSNNSDDETITLKKDELVNLITKVVNNILEHKD